MGFRYNNYGDLWLSLSTGASVTVADYDFAGAPDVSFYGSNITAIMTDCQNFNVNIGSDVNRNGAFQFQTFTKFQITYCDMNTTKWSINASGAFELGPYNRIRNQVQELGFGGGASYNYPLGINCHHNYITGGGCNAPDTSHIELWQQLSTYGYSSDNYCYIEDNMFDFSKDGQKTTMSPAGWTGVVSLGGVLIKFNRNIVKGIDIVCAHPANPQRMGCIVAYGDPDVTAGFELSDNAMSFSPVYSPTFKHGGGVLKPTPVNNRTFRDGDSDTAGYTVPGPADNVLITSADLN